MEPGGAGLTRRGQALLAVAVLLAISAFLFGIKELYPVAVAALVAPGRLSGVDRQPGVGRAHHPPCPAGPGARRHDGAR